MNIGIYLYDNAEVLDFSGPFEVFSTASRLAGTKDLFNVFLIAEQDRPVMARGGFSVNPAYHFANSPTIDVLIVAGGVHQAELEKPVVLHWLQQTAANARLVASVCTGVFILAEAGVISSGPVTTHWEDIAELRQRYPALQTEEGQRWVDQGTRVTSGGISAGIDMSLHLVARLASDTLASATARQMEFDWQSRNTALGSLEPVL